ncbi:MAG: single-stranded-DNA-specific exonuclease RecJ [Bacteroidales bacterium]|nr:single-stranded-DNA-specific exonuclease RecJ [Bacteroidales bacterium]MBN2819174.1 single-stranded-DNA-specific exonuclease RecJ [Bacteroidales bacterium]
MDKYWKIRENGDSEIVNRLSEELNINHVLSNLLVQRGIVTFDLAKAFFRPSLDDLHDPFLMKDMEVAVNRLQSAIENNEHILVYGDYDVDGTTSVSLVYSFLKKFYNNIDYYIPDRYSEGYGVSIKGIDYAVSKKIGLIIALDCGIKANEKIDYAAKNGVDFIICDHHTPGAYLPQAVAVLDPKRSDCEYPYKELSGCGVGFKFMHAWAIKSSIAFTELLDHIDLVAVSIASDIVPITDENRILTYFGLKKLEENPGIGLKTIKDKSGIEIGKSIAVEDVVFKIGPRINAAGRMDSGKQAVDLLISGSEKEARLLCDRLNVHNQTRRNIDKNITEEAINEIKQQSHRYKNSTVLYNPKWHKGVVGIVASRLIESYYRPTVVLTESNGFATGSARSVNGFDLYEAINACSDLLESFGGHMYAAGLTMKPENVQKFKDRFENIVTEKITSDQLIPQVEIDTELNFNEINDKFYKILKQFAPFGPGNMNPVFFAENVVDNGTGRCVGPEREHLKLSLLQESDPFRSINAIAFGQGKKFNRVTNGKAFDIAYTLIENTFRGQTTLQLNVRDIKVDN